DPRDGGVDGARRAPLRLGGGPRRAAAARRLPAVPAEEAQGEVVRHAGRPVGGTRARGAGADTGAAAGGPAAAGAAGGGLGARAAGFRPAPGGRRLGGRRVHPTADG